MSRLIQWLDHRMEVMGIENWKDLSEYAGLSQELFQDLRVRGSLEVLNRSARRLVAAALHVSLRRLEWLDEGRIDWIDDAHVVTVDPPGRPPPWREGDLAQWVENEAGPENRGTPVIGRIRPNGMAEPEEDWDEEWGRRLRARFGEGRDVYALELEGAERCIVFRNIANWAFREGQAAVYCWNGWNAEGWFGRVRLRPEHAVVVTPDGQRHEVDLLSVVRIGRVIGRWPPAADELRVSSQVAGDRERGSPAGQEVRVN